MEVNADLDSLVPRFYYEAKAHVTDLFAGDQAPDGDEEDGPHPPSMNGRDAPEDVLELPPTAVPPQVPAPEQAPRWKLLEERRLDPDRPAVGSYCCTTAFRVSPTDPDVTPMWAGSRTSLGYHDHYVVDGGKARVILAALITPADVMENVPLRDLLWRVCFRRKMRPGHMTGDTTYGTVENIVALEDAGIRAFFPLPDFEARTPFFGKSAFTYDFQRDEYRCPQGQPLPRRKTKCTASDHGRIVHRSFYADYLERVRGYHITEPYQKAMRKRKVWGRAAFR